MARASERARRAEWAKDQIAAQFEEHVSQAERNVSVLREELASCTAELYEALSEAKTKAAEETQRADEAERQLAEQRAASAELQAQLEEQISQNSRLNEDLASRPGVAAVAERVQHAEERADEAVAVGKAAAALEKAERDRLAAILASQQAELSSLRSELAGQAKAHTQQITAERRAWQIERDGLEKGAVALADHMERREQIFKREVAAAQQAAKEARTQGLSAEEQVRALRNAASSAVEEATQGACLNPSPL